MSGFVQALDSYRNGNLSRDELLAEIERQLAAGEADAADLPDGLHPNAAGYLRIGERFYAAARRFLSR